MGSGRPAQTYSPRKQGAHDFAALRRRLGGAGGNGPLIEIDGGVNAANMASLVAAGAQIFVAGNAVFSQPDPAQAVSRLKAIARSLDRP